LCPANVEASEKQSAEVEKWRGSAFPGQEGGRAQPRGEGRGGEGRGGGHPGLLGHLILHKTTKICGAQEITKSETRRVFFKVHKNQEISFGATAETPGSGAWAEPAFGRFWVNENRP